MRTHLEHHDFKLRLRQALPTFDASGYVELTDPRGRKRGSTGMIFVATRKVKVERAEELGPSAPETKLPRKESESETYLSGASVQPSLELQLHALSMEQLEARLRYFGEVVREVRAEEFFHIGFKEKRRAELVHSLLAIYHRGARCRVYERFLEEPLLPMEGVQQLLEVLRKVNFDENLRPTVHASGYLVLKAAQAVKFAESWGEERVLGHLWQVAEELLRGASTKAATFHFTAMAVTKNFRGSPHIDQNDFSVQYALSVGDFDEGGELCVEETPELVKVLKTHNRLVCIDGRFPHWVSGYSGERYSIILYRTAGDWDPPYQAVHPI